MHEKAIAAGCWGSDDENDPDEPAPAAQPKGGTPVRDHGDGGGDSAPAGPTAVAGAEAVAEVSMEDIMATFVTGHCQFDSHEVDEAISCTFGAIVSTRCESRNELDMREFVSGKEGPIAARGAELVLSLIHI